MNKFAFENDRYLERNVKAVVEKIARDFNLHLKVNTARIVNSL